MTDDRKLFADTASYYAKYRAKYPPELFNYISKTFNLDGKGRLLDLGCGTGQIAIPFASKFEEVIGLDPEQTMLDEAHKETAAEHVENIRWICKKAEDINSDLGKFRLVTMGKSFHWMDQRLVLKKVYELLDKNGGVVIVGGVSNPGKDGWRIDEDVWVKARKEIVKKYFGEKRRAGNSLYVEPKDKFDDLVRETFGNCETWTHTYTRELSLDEAANEIYSTSYVSRKELGDNLEDFDKDVRKALRAIEPSGRFVEHITIQTFIGRK